MPVGYNLRAFDVLSSTNAECARLAEAGATGNIWVITDKQTSGKGRRGRAWVSQSGNLFTSLLYRLDCDLATASQLSFVAALAVRDVVVNSLQRDDICVTCKWPNDILVAGKKISGILLETAGQGGESPAHIIIGIGVNISHHPEDALYPATNIADEAMKNIDLEIIFERLVQSMSHWITIWKNHGFSLIQQEWKQHAYGLMQDIIVRLPHEELKGRFIDLDENGALILELDGKRRHITAGDVFFV